MAGQNNQNLWYTIPSLLFCENTLPNWRCWTSLTLRQCISLIHRDHTKFQSVNISIFVINPPVFKKIDFSNLECNLLTTW